MNFLLISGLSNKNSRATITDDVRNIPPNGIKATATSAKYLAKYSMK